MNFRLLLPAMLLLIFSSCNEDLIIPEEDEEMIETNDEEFDYSSFDGSYIWVRSTGGFSGEEINPMTEGVDKCLIIEDRMFRFMVNDTIHGEFPFEVAFGKSIYNADSVPIIYLEDFFAFSYSYEGASFILKEEFFDGYIHEYTFK